MQHLFFQLGRQLQLQPDGSHQNKNKRTQQHRHQITENRPYGCSRFNAGVQFVVHAGTESEEGRFPAACCSSSMICFCDITLKSIRSEEHTSELQSLMRISYAVFCLKTQKTQQNYSPIQ